MSHYWGSMFRKPVEISVLASGEAGGFNALERMREKHNIVVVMFVVTFFSSVLRIMDRVEQNVLPRSADPMAFKASFGSDFTMLSVTAAIIAQVTITALALPNLNQVHWTATAGFVTSLVTGCMSVWVSTTTSRCLNSLDSPSAIRDWLSKPASTDSRLEFEKELKRCFDASDSFSTEEAESIRRSFAQFLDDNKWKSPSFYACTMLTAPSLLLNVSLPAFLLALGIYLGSVWKQDLDPVAGSVASRAVMICYIVCLVLACGLFFGASNQKEADRDFTRRWMDDLSRKVHVEKVFGTVGQVRYRGSKAGLVVGRRGSVPVDDGLGTGLMVQAGGAGKIEILEAV